MTGAETLAATPGPLQVRWAWWCSAACRPGRRRLPLVTPTPRGSSGGGHRLPGAPARTTLYEVADAYRRPVGMVLAPASVSVTLTCAPGAGTLEAWFERLDGWLSGLPRRPGIVGCTAIVAPSPFLLQATWPVDTTGRDHLGDVAAAVGADVPRLVRSLARGGVGCARPLAADEVALAVRSAYDLACPPIDDPDPKGEVSDWAAAAPVDHFETWQHLRHGDTVSSTWSVRGVPPGLTTARILALINRAAGSSGVAGADVSTRVALVCRAGGAGPTDTRRTTLVTLSTSGGDPRMLATAAAALCEGLPRELRPWLRPCYGYQATAFATGLPTGILQDQP